MGIFDRLLGKRKAAEKPGSEHAVLVRLRLSAEEFGTQDERAAIHGLSDQLAKAMEAAGVGEFDGDEFGAGECTLFMYGSDADALFRVVEPILRTSPLTRGAIVRKRYGAAADPAAREEEVRL